ncbi:MAG: hypothetical protein ISS29_09235 [Candidatus Marinimicrobia bacterium]|nr:hypothetical protein [Candidatus Neomarinimicrobiota bacterium]
MNTIITISDILIRLLETMVWPLTVLILTYFFRSEIKKFFSRISSFKYKGIEAEFKKELNQAEETAKSTIHTFPKVNSIEEALDKDRSSEIISLLEISPKSAIVLMWPHIEKASIDAAERLGIFIPQGFTGHHVFQLLKERMVLDDEIISIFRQLRNLRNKATHMHDFTINIEQAERYVSLGSGVIKYLNQIENIA